MRRGGGRAQLFLGDGRTATPDGNVGVGCPGALSDGAACGAAHAAAGAGPGAGASSPLMTPHPLYSRRGPSQGCACSRRGPQPAPPSLSLQVPGWGQDQGKRGVGVGVGVGNGGGSGDWGVVVGNPSQKPCSLLLWGIRWSLLV